jgi:plastocyanin
MRRKLWMVVAAAALMLATVGASGSLASPQARQQMVIRNFSYFPNTATVAPGTTIVVTNLDALRMRVPHTLTANNGAFDTGVIKGDAVSFVAPTTPGIYNYHCEIHHFMMGSITVSGG